MLSLIVALLALQAAASVERTNCAQLQPAQLDLQPLGRGPLRLASIHCHQGPGSGGGGVRPLMSPDGEQVATVSRYDPEGQISFFPLRAGARTTSFDTGVGGFMSFGATSTMAPVSWSADSKFVWTARQQRMGPTGGWALTPLAPLRVYPDGRTEELPRLTHPAGSLDGLLWAGGKGLALAQFGTHGQFYRPVRPTPRRRSRSWMRAAARCWRHCRWRSSSHSPAEK